MDKMLGRINSAIWGMPLLTLILGVGFYLTLRLRFVQITAFPKALGYFLRQLLPGRREDDESSFRSLCTALAATVGTGNLVGVAGAICLGGPGAVFWMWLCGILAMVTKYTEALLAVRYRVRTAEGCSGGPMYMITLALPKPVHFLAGCYAAFGMLASLGVGNAAQINAAMSGFRQCFLSYGRVLSPGGNLLLTMILSLTVGIVLFKGAGVIARTAERLVPVAAAAYILLCAGVLMMRWKRIPDALLQIVQGAFTPGAVTGGLIGSSFQALRIGCSRGVFTNEAGMGTASIAHAAAEGVHPVRQGYMGIMEVFLDTIVICTMTALVILVSGIPIPYGADAGGILTSQAFSVIYGPGAALLLAVSAALFAIAAVLGWSFYGARCAEFLFGRKIWPYFAGLQVITVFFGAFLQTSWIWQLSEAVNGLMAVPNLIALALLAPEAVRLTKDYKNSGKAVAGGG